MKTKVLLASVLLFCGSSSMAQPGNQPKTLELIPKVKWLKEKVRVESSSLGTFETAVYDFGQVPIGDSIWHKFQFKNVGKAEMEISEVIASCSCTVTNYTQEKIKPSKKGYVIGGFKVKQAGEMTHTLTIFDNSPNSPRYVEMKFVGIKK